MSLKSILFFTLLAVSFAGSSQSVNIPASNTGVSAGSSSLQRKPLGAYYGYERSAFIYSPYELGINDTVSVQSVAFFLEGLTASGISASLPVKVYLKDIPDTLFASSSTPATEMSGATLVFNGNLANTDFTINNWVTIPCSFPFVHFADKSLEVIVETNAGGSGSDNSTISKVFRRNDANAKRFQYWQQDNTAPSGAGTLDTLRPNITINYTNASLCTGTPTAGSALASDTAVCVNSTVDLMLSGVNGGSQITYQWQLSMDGVNYTDIAGANQLSYTYTMTAATWFRGVVSCGVNSDISTPVYVNLLLPTYCYCSTALGGGCSGYSIDSLSIIGTGFNASLNGCENNMAPHYSAYAPTGNYTATLGAGQTYTLTIRQTGNNITSLWIDYNHDGVFGTTEWTQVNTVSATGALFNKTFTTGTFALNGLTGMRVRSRASGVLNDSTCACTGFNSGETEDFMITITGGGTIGIEDHLSTMDAKVFPNPSKGSFVVETGGKNTAFLVEVSDILGNVIFSKTEESGDGRIRIDLNADPGVYLVRGLNILNRSAFVKKIVIE
jgi:hypothetical protein